MSWTPATHVLTIDEGYDQSFSVLDDCDEDGRGYSTTIEGPAIVRLRLETSAEGEWFVTADDREHGSIGCPDSRIEEQGVTLTALPPSVAGAPYAWPDPYDVGPYDHDTEDEPW